MTPTCRRTDTSDTHPRLLTMTRKSKFSKTNRGEGLTCAPFLPIMCNGVERRGPLGLTSSSVAFSVPRLFDSGSGVRSHQGLELKRWHPGLSCARPVQKRGVSFLTRSGEAWPGDSGVNSPVRKRNYPGRPHRAKLGRPHRRRGRRGFIPSWSNRSTQHGAPTRGYAFFSTLAPRSRGLSSSFAPSRRHPSRRTSRAPGRSPPGAVALDPIGTSRQTLPRNEVTSEN